MAADQVLSILSVLEHKKSDYKSVAVSCFFFFLRKDILIEVTVLNR